MKKFAVFLLTAALLLAGVPLPSPASAAGSGDAVIDQHGTKTYIGLASDWSKKWDPDNSDNFTDITGQDYPDIPGDGDVTVKAGTVGKLTVPGNLTVSGGEIGDAHCEKRATVSGGSLKSLYAVDGISMTAGTVRHDLTSDEGGVSLNGTVTVGGAVGAGGDISLNGTVTVGGGVTAPDFAVTFGGGKAAVSGSVTAKDVTLGSSASAKIGGKVEVSDTLLLNSGSLTAAGIDGESATVEAAGFTGALPAISGIDAFKVDANKKIILNQKLTLVTLELASGSELVDYDPLEVDSLSGPGTLCIDSGELTVHTSIAETPMLLFNDPVGSGDTAFRADKNAVLEGEVQTYGYSFEKQTSGDSDLFRLVTAGSQGLSLDQTSLTVAAGSPATVRASVSPSFSKYATGTQIVWQLDGDSSVFSVSPDSGGLNCKVSASASVSGRHRAILTAYLADRQKTYLSGYKARSCVLSTGNASQTSPALDTSYVSLLVGNSYGLLATTNASAAPAAISYNSAVAVITGTKAARDKNGNPGWLYTVTGQGNGSTIIDVSGSQMAVTVNSGILMDTLSYTMAPGASYCAGVLARGVGESDIGVSSSSADVGVAFYKKGSDGMMLYRITGVRAGSAEIVFAVSGGQSVKMSVTVKPGAASSGKSARLVALKQ